MILEAVKTRGRIVRSEVVDLCDLGDYQASRLLRKLAKQGKLVKKGERRGSYYEPA